MSDERALSVSEVVHLAKSALERIRVRVVGEISELTDKPGYKAVYFSLADAESVLPCLIWRDVFSREDVALADGMLVEATGFLTVYPAKGRLQFQVRSITLAGEGVLRVRVAALARKLGSEGLLADDRKRPLPALPGRIGLVTSPRGKAVHDVIRTLSRRYPLGELVFAGVAVEGRDAADEIVAGVAAVSQAGVDVVIVCRGGGSYEDLMPFNEEAVARAIAACPVPVVTGIGHEPDTTIADMVADVRASTPTAAAEAVAPSVDELDMRLAHATRRLARGLGSAATTASHRVASIAGRAVFRDPFALTGPLAQRLDSVVADLGRALPLRVERDASRLGALGDRLDDLSPHGILRRGYSICYGGDGKAVRVAESLSRGDRLDIRFAVGRADCTVDEVDAEA